MLNTYCSTTQNRACHQEFPLTLPLPTDPLRSHLSSPCTDFMLQRGAPSLRHSPKKSRSISLEIWLLIRELHFRCRRLFSPSFQLGFLFFRHSFSSLFPFLYYTGSISLVIVYLSSVLLGDCCEKEEVKDSKVTIEGDLMTASPCHSLLSKIHNRTSVMGLKP